MASPGRHPFVAALLSMISSALWARVEAAKPMSMRDPLAINNGFVLPPQLSRGCHRKNSSRLGGSVKAHARASKKARNVRRNRAAHR